MTEISDRFPLAEVDHQELIEIFTLRYGTCWRVTERQIAFPAHRDHQLRLELRHGQIIRIWAGNSLSDQELDGLLDQIEADLKDKRIADAATGSLGQALSVAGGLGCAARIDSIDKVVCSLYAHTSRRRLRTYRASQRRNRIAIVRKNGTCSIGVEEPRPRASSCDTELARILIRASVVSHEPHRELFSDGA